MPKASNRATRFRIAVLGAMVIVIVQLQAVGPASADFFAGFMHILQRRAPGPIQPPLAYANPTADPWRIEDLPRELLAPAAPAAPAGTTVTYCVRLCDGRYFPVQRQAVNSSPAKICAAQCPASRTGIFTGSAIDNAVRSDGLRYAGLEAAFVYRDRVVAGCTCNGKDPYGLAAIDIEADPTLERGDVVVTDKGPVAFVGDQRLPHRAAEFVPVNDSPLISKSLRKQLGTLRVVRLPANETWLPEALAQTVPPSVSRQMPADLSTLVISPTSNLGSAQPKFLAAKIAP